MSPSLRRPLPDPRRALALGLLAALAAVGLGTGPGRSVPVAFAAPAGGRGGAPGLRVRSVRVLPASAFTPAHAFDRDGATLWLAQVEDGRLRLEGRGAGGDVTRESVAPGLELRQPPLGIAPTAAGTVVYGESPAKDGAKDGWFAYAQAFDHAGTPATPWIYRGHAAVRAAAGSDDGGLAMLVHVFDTVTFHGTAVSGPPVASRQPATVALLRVGPTGTLDWLRKLDAESALRDPTIVGARDGRLALLWAAEAAKGTGGGLELWTRDGKTAWTAPDLQLVSSAAFAAGGAIWAVGSGAPPPPHRGRLQHLPAQAGPQVLDVYDPQVSRRVLCAGCLVKPQIGVDDAGDVVLLTAVSRPFRFDGVDFPADRLTVETWALLQISGRHLRAHHTLTATQARLAVGTDGRVAIVATGVRGATSLDGRPIGAQGQTVLLQLDR